MGRLTLPQSTGGLEVIFFFCFNFTSAGCKNKRCEADWEHLVAVQQPGGVRAERRMETLLSDSILLLSVQRHPWCRRCPQNMKIAHSECSWRQKEKFWYPVAYSLVNKEKKIPKLPLKRDDSSFLMWQLKLMEYFLFSLSGTEVWKNTIKVNSSDDNKHQTLLIISCLTHDPQPQDS